ncbi:MAG: DUF559 domain-containing protein [Flavobacteriales bacterium]|nr:DUF559 domain-containing protein [Flavobacteriales bacterium]
MHEVILDTEENNVLAAYLPSTKDLAIALEHGWYRIPALHAPPIIRDGKATHIAFYQPKAFDDDRYMVRWYAPITGLVIRKRSEILPDEPLHPHATKDYYVVGCAGMQQLAKAIPSKIPRRAIFFPTTLEKLFTATDINHLFNDSHLETLLWNEMLKADVPSERQFDIRAGGQWFKLDFAVFCKTANIDIECDGDTHQRSAGAVEKDKRRSNLLASAGWNVLRFTRSVLRTEMESAMSMVHDTINRYGGLIDPDSDGGFRYTSGPDDPQPRLFD